MHFKHHLHCNSTLDLNFIPSSCNLLISSGDSTTISFNVNTQQKLQSFIGHNTSVKWNQPHPNNENLFISCGRDGKILIYDMRCNFSLIGIKPVLKLEECHNVVSLEAAMRRKGKVSYV